MITRAIIPVAGWGTRRLPITKAISKSMLPIGNRPLIDYVVQDCIKAGITDIYIIHSDQGDQIKQYYSNNRILEEYLEQQGKHEMIDVIQPPEASFHFIEQPNTEKYGTTIPVAIAASHVPDNEPVVVVMGDDFIYNKDGSSEIARLIEASKQGEIAAMLSTTVPLDQVSRYGVIEKDENDSFVRIVERPSQDEAPSNLINVSKYVVPPELMKMIAQHAETDQEGEYYIIDPINQYVASGNPIKVVQSQGQYLDGGSLEGWLYANKVVHEDV